MSEQPGDHRSEPAGHAALEQKLRETRQRFERAFSEAPVGMAIGAVDAQDAGRYLQVNRAFCELTGYSDAELLARRFEDISHPDDVPAQLEARRRLGKGEISTYETDKRYVRPNGETVWARVHVTLIRDSDGRPLHALIIAMNIDRHKQAEQALRESEARYRGIVETTTDGVWMLDEHDKTCFVNDAFASMLGYERHELDGKPAGELMVGDSGTIRARALNRQAEGRTRREEVRLRRGDGSVIWAELSASPLDDSENAYRGAVVVVADSTARRNAERERHQLEFRLAQVQRLETVGQLAGGVAHDFNNLLAVILNYAYFVREQLPASSTLVRDIDEIRQAAERATDLTHQLLVFSRQEAIKPEVLDVGSVMREMEQLLHRALGEHVELVLELAPDECNVNVDRSQLEQVVMNLAVNARDAMPEGGPIKIATKRIEVGRDGARAPDSLPPGGYVTVSVRDEGAGMAPDVASHAFEPFFTTKPKGTGTGLGLATVYGTVTAIGGEAEIDSTPGVGTTVRVWLPEAPVPSDDRADLAFSTNGDGSQPKPKTVLVVEDEDAVRRLTCRILDGGGFTCLAAGSGDEALELVSRTEGDIDLLVTDVVMPGMSGKELAERLGGDSGLPVLFMSGYTDDAIPYREQLEREHVLLHKPFTAESLLRTVDEVLEAARTRAARSGG